MTRDPHTALIVVDMQNMFVDAVGAEGPGVLAAVNEHVAMAASRGWPIYYTRDYAPDELPEPDPQRRAKLHPDLEIRGTVVTKGPGKDGAFSGFLHSAAEAEPGVGGLNPLAELLHRSHVSDVVVVGIAADVCVAATARDALRLGYRVSIPLDATAFVHAHPRGDQAALDDLTAAGVRLVGGAMSAERPAPDHLPVSPLVDARGSFESVRRQARRLTRALRRPAVDAQDHRSQRRRPHRWQREAAPMREAAFEEDATRAMGRSDPDRYDPRLTGD